MSKPSAIGRPRSVNLSAAREPSLRALASFVGPVIYVVRWEDGGIIKIGHTVRLGKRVTHYGGLKTLVALQPGDREAEQAIHRALSDHRHHAREYYHPTPEVLNVVNAMRAAMGFQPLTN